MSQSQKEGVPQPWASPARQPYGQGPSKCRSDAPPRELELEVRAAEACCTRVSGIPMGVAGTQQAEEV